MNKKQRKQLKKRKQINKRKRQANDSSQYEVLEPRQLLAGLSLYEAGAQLATIDANSISGVTVITHGFARGDGDSYMTSVADAIIAKHGGYKVVQHTDAVGETGTFEVFPLQAGSDSDGLYEIVLVNDWVTESSLSSSGWAEGAGDGLFNVLTGLGLAVPQQTKFPYHFIAHSFGSAVASETVERFAYHNINVDHLTYLDPHDFDQDLIPVDTFQDLWTLGAPYNLPITNNDSFGASVWQNVAFADVYYQTRSDVEVHPNQISGWGAIINANAEWFIPDGRPIPGAYNVHFSGTMLNEFNDGSSSHDHGHVTSGYIRSIKNPSDPYFDQGDFGPYGYQLSRLGNGSRPSSQNSAGSYYSAFQDHEHSPEFIVSSSGNPIQSNLVSIGLSVADIEVGRWAPQIFGLDVYNGNFDHGSFSPIRLNSKSITPGWSQQGGQTAVVKDGEGVIFNGRFYQTGSSRSDDRRPLTHNYIYLLPQTKSIEFDLRIETGSAPNNSLMIGNHSVFVTVEGSDRIANMAIPTSDLAIDYSTGLFRIAIPTELRGQAVTLKFQLVGPGQSTDNGTVDEIRIDNVKQSLVDPGPVAADLLPTWLTTTTQQMEVGDAVSVDFSVKNVGGTQAGGFDVQFVLSQQKDLTGAYYNLGPLQTMDSIAIGQVLTLEEDIVLAVGSGVPSGDYFLGVIVDPGSSGGAIPESDEDNNVKFTDSIVRVGSPQGAQLADIQFSNVISPPQGVTGSKASITFTIDNVGLGSVAQYDVEFVLRDGNGAPYPVFPTFTLDRFGTFTREIDIPSNLPVGAYSIQGIANEGRAIPEVTFANNSMTDLETTIQISNPINAANVGFQFPVGDPATGSYTQNGFDSDNHTSGHLGYDFGGHGEGAIVSAVADGVVTYAYDTKSPSWGKVVIIRHQTKAWGWNKDVYSFYGHVEPEVGVDDVVRRGDRIATVGEKALNSTAAHLHFEIRSGNSKAGLIPGPGYHSGNFYQNYTDGVPDGFKISGYQYEHDIKWHSPYEILSENNFFTSATSHVDLVPSYVNAGFTANAGETISVYAEIENRGASSIGSYDVTFVISENRAISARDRFLQLETRSNGVSGHSFDRFNANVVLPVDLIEGKEYWIGVMVDVGDSVDEYDDSNNDLGDRTPITIVATSSTEADLIGAGLELRNVRDSYSWGTSIQFQYKVQNSGVADADASRVRFFLSDHQSNPNFEYELGSKPLAALPVGRIGGGIGRFRMPLVAPAWYAGGELFVRMEVDYENAVDESNDGNNQSVGESIDWIRLPK